MRPARRAFAAFAAAICAACVTPAADTIADGIAQTSAAPLGLTFDTADGLGLEGRAGLQRLVVSRPVPQERIAAIRFRLRDKEGQVKRDTVMSMRDTRHGLQYFSHRTVKPGTSTLDEAGVGLFGMTSVAYWASFTPAWTPAPAPDVRLVRGRMFTTDAAFTVRTMPLTGGGIATNCEPASRRAASAIHPRLAGEAIEFNCVETIEEDGDEVRRVVVYLPRYAQYLPRTNFDDDGSVATQFDVVDVDVRAITPGRSL